MGRELFLTITYLIVIFSIIVQGLSIGPLVKKVISKSEAQKI
jgi:CPA1 family monovalent cation:H+ antiporter